MQTLLSIVFLCPLLCKMARQAKSMTGKRVELHILLKSNNLKTKLRMNKQQQKLANKARSVSSLKRTVGRKQRCYHFLENNFGITLRSSQKLRQIKK
uniref:Putative secreted protein n=1 Tax=Ixodes ricinus TaxID=34613 RepID=A0A6B0UAI3_IXORI